MPGTALITGANGFVGSHLTDLLLERGWTVRCLVRETSDLRWLPREKVELVYGSVADGRGLGEAVRGVQTIFHGAAVTRAPSESVYLNVNAGGTRRLLEHLPPDLQRFVLISSLAAGGPSPPGKPRTESDPDAPVGFYGKSKLAAEVELREKAGRVPWTILRPAAVYGSRDRDFLKLALLARRGWTFRLSGKAQEVCLVHVRDLVRGMLEAAESSRTRGRTYYLSRPEATTWAALGSRMAVHLGRPVRTLVVPRALIPWIGRGSGLLSVLARRENPLPPDRIRDLVAEAWTCDPSRAEEEFGFQNETDLESGLKETMDWYRERGWL